ncbi:MAG TPA: TonB family protein [Xanthomonadales bacterium]|nr:TonB family protein [Xanthomonadales bacterium]
MVRASAALALLLSASVVLAAGDDLLAVGPQDLPKVWKLRHEKWKVRTDTTDAKTGVGCAAISFVIEPNGRTSNFKVLRTVPEGDYEQAAKELAKAFRFEPGPMNAKKEAVFTYMTVTFNNRRDKTLGSNIREPITIDSRLNRMCAVEGFDFGD